MKNLIQLSSHKEWLEARAITISSTESAALFGISPWVTEYELWQRKYNKNMVIIEENERMLWGKRLEAVIGVGVAEDKGWKVEHLDNSFVLHEDFDRMGSSFDFFISESEFGPGLMEIKNVDLFRFKDEWVEPSEEDKEGKIPMHIDMQLQHQLEVANLEWGCVVALVGGNRVVIFMRKRNKKIGAAILEKTREFWKAVDGGDSPDPDYKNDAAYIVSMYPNSTEGKLLDLSDNERLEVLLGEYKGFASSEKIAKEEKAARKAEIMEIIKDGQKVECGEYRVTLSNIKPKEVSYTRDGYRGFYVIKNKKELDN